VAGALAYGAPQRITEVKAADDGWEVAGYASTWSRDLGDDIVHPGAFKATLAAGGKVRFLFAHDAAQVLGRPLELKEDATGLFGRFRISKTRLGQDVHTLLAQFVGLGYDRHGGGGFDASDTFGKFCDRYCFTHWGHTRFPDLIFLAFCSFTAGSNFSRSFRSTMSGTNPSTAPPSRAISRTSRELR